MKAITMWVWKKIYSPDDWRFDYALTLELGRRGAFFDVPIAQMAQMQSEAS